MKGLRFVPVLIICIAVYLVSSSRAFGSQYLGDVCFLVNNTTEGSTSTLKLGVTDMGGYHYQLNGFFITNGQPIVIGGNGELLNKKVIMQLSNSTFRMDQYGVNTGINVGMTNVELNPATLNGSFVSISFAGHFSWGSSGGTPTAYASKGTMTLTQCP